MITYGGAWADAVAHASCVNDADGLFRDTALLPCSQGDVGPPYTSDRPDSQRRAHAIVLSLQARLMSAICVLRQ